MKRLENKETRDERCRFRPIKNGGIRMVLRLTLQCDLECPHCLVGKKRKDSELSTEQWLTLIQQFSDIDVKKVLLTGGEPLLRDDIICIVKALSGFGIITDLNSNLHRMSSRLMKDLKLAGLSEISVSLEGPEDIHDRMHGCIGAYKKLVEAISWAALNGIPVDAACCLTQDNYNYIIDLIKIIDKLPVRSLTFSRLLPIGHGIGYRQGLTQEELNNGYNKIQKMISSGINFPIRITGFQGAPRPSDCERGNSLLSMAPDGSLLGCVLSGDNPSVDHPLEVGLAVALNNLRKELAKRQFELCWQNK